MFGTYVEADEDRVITNTNEVRTFPGVYLGPVGNIQGTKAVFDIKTGVVKEVRTVKEFPMPDNVIMIVNAWGKRYQKEKKKKLLTFHDRNKQAFDWENEELSGDTSPSGVASSAASRHSGPALLHGIPLEGDDETDDGDLVEDDITPQLRVNWQPLRLIRL